jgi:hypothetical protein
MELHCPRTPVFSSQPDLYFLRELILSSPGVLPNLEGCVTRLLTVITCLSNQQIFINAPSRAYEFMQQPVLGRLLEWVSRPLSDANPFRLVVMQCARYSWFGTEFRAIDGFQRLPWCAWDTSKDASRDLIEDIICHVLDEENSGYDDTLAWIESYREVFLSQSYRLGERVLWQEHILSSGVFPLLSRLLELKTHWWNNLVLHDLAVAGDAVSSSNGEHGLSIDLQEG